MSNRAIHIIFVILLSLLTLFASKLFGFKFMPAAIFTVLIPSGIFYWFLSNRKETKGN